MSLGVTFLRPLRSMPAGWRVRSVPPPWIGWLAIFCVMLPAWGVDGTLFRVDYGCKLSCGRLRLRGGGSDEGALGDWSEVEKALEDSRRELKINVESEEEGKQLPDSLWQCYHLNRLEITGGKLKSLPEGIGQLDRLTTLIVSGNKLTSLPPEIGSLECLRVLEAENNELEELPETLGSCSKLEVVNVAGNRLCSLSPLAPCAALTTLKADANQIQDPDEVPVEELGRLKVLSLSNNMLPELPLGIGSLQALESLNCAGNQITRFPAELGELREKTFKSFVFEDNPLVDKNRLSKILAKSKKPIKELLEFIAKQPQGGGAKGKREKQTKAAKVVPEDGENEQGPGASASAPNLKQDKASELKMPKKMSRRQQEAYRQAQEALRKTQTENAPPTDAKEEDKAEEESGSESDGEDESSEEESGESEEESDSEEEDGPAPALAEFPTDAHTGVKYRSQAELMVDRGEAEDVEHARRILRQRLGLGGLATSGEKGKGKGRGKGAQSKAFAAPDCTETMQIPSRSVGLVIGKGGATIKKLQADSGARISINTDKEEIIDGVPHCKVVLSGSGEAVEKAEALVRKLLPSPPAASKHQPPAAAEHQPTASK